MKSSKKVLAFALAAAMVVTAVPATNAQAASTAKLSAKKATVYSEGYKTVTVKTPKSWKSVKVTATSNKKSVAKVKKTAAKKIKVTGVKPGTAKVTVKVTYKTSTKKSAKTKTKKLTYTMKVAKVGVALSGDSVVAVGSTTKLTNTKKNSSRAKITYTSSDDSIATVAADGTVTGVKAGKATITAKITVGKDSAETTKDVEVKNVILDSVTPTEANKVVAIVKGNTKNLKKADFVVTGTETKATVAVTDISVDAKDATKVTLTLAAKLTDAKEYGVALDGITKTFVASDGKVDSISVDPVQIPYAEATEIDLLAKDTKGIIVNRMKWNNPDAGFSFTFTKYDGTLQGEKLYLNKIGSVAEGKITYTSSEYNADGTPKVKLEQPFTITAVDQATVNNYAVRLGKSTDKFDKLKDDNKLAVEDNKYAFIKIKDANDKEVSDYSKYTVESSDKNILLLGSSSINNADHKVQVKAVTTGTAYIIIKKDGKYCTSLPINVVAKREAASLTIDNAAFTLSNTTKIADNKVVTAKAKDQYGDDITIGTNALSAECVYVDAKSGSAVKVSDVNTNNANKYVQKTADDKITFKGQVEPGTYTWTINLKVSDTKTLKQTVSVTVKNLDDTKKNISYALEASDSEIDAVVKDDAKNGDSSDATVQIALCKDGVKSDYQTVNYTVKKDGKVVTGAGLSVDGTTVTAEKANGKLLKITAMSVSGNVATKLAAGTYEVTAEWKDTNNVDYSQKTQVVVKDTQTGADAQVVNAGVSTATKTTVKDLAEDTLKVVLGDTTYVNVDKKSGDQALIITKIEGNTISASGDITGVKDLAPGAEVNISKITFTAKTSSGVSYDYTVSVGRTVTNK
ncbi:Ig-like domain-containing protein [Roseburia faecis]|uniref:Ig-like domain-containing protein n=1 Tax=Roseburia faecis TaxID=301302 RepID=UPI001920D80F|nr:Ig-like domain-containing protein [Roseburia faecis]